MRPNPMYTALEKPVDISQLVRWLQFSDFPRFDPKNRNWIRVYQRGSKFLKPEYGKASQVFQVQPVLVPLKQMDEFLDSSPWGVIPNFRFRGGGPVSSSKKGDYWDDGAVRSPTGIDVHRFLTDFEYQAPQLEPGFIDYHNLIEEEVNNFVTRDRSEPVTKFWTEKWWDMVNNRGEEYDDTILFFDIDAGHLLDYLEVRNCALVLAYFQSRKVTKLNEEITLPTVEKKEVAHLDGPAVKACRWVREETYPYGELHWFCPIFPDSYDSSVSKIQSQYRELKFDTYRGHRFSPEEVLNREGFEEKGFKRPATGAKDLDEALSYHDWVFFEMGVLQKYYESSNGTVHWGSRQYGQVSLDGKLSLSIYRNSKHEVVFFLDELKSLYDTEIPHWQSHNRRPSAEIPQEAIITGILAEFVETDSYSGDVFQSINSLNDRFKEVHGSPLFSPMTPNDDATAEKIIMPPRNEKSALLDTMDHLHQVFIERILEDNIVQVLPRQRKSSVEGRKSALYELTEMSLGPSPADDIFDSINAVYDLRVAADHRGGSRWDNALRALNMDPTTNAYRDLYVEIMTSLSSSLKSIEENL